MKKSGEVARIVLCGLVVIVLAACTPSADEFELNKLATGLDIKEFTQLNSEKPLIVPEEGNCAVNEFNMPGQGLHLSGSGLHLSGSGLHLSGSVGGLAFAPETAKPEREGNVIAGQFGLDAAGRAAIVVVDDFEGQGYQISEGVFKAADFGDLQAVGQDIQNGKATFSHGAAVFNHISGLLDGTNAYDLINMTNNYVEWQNKNTGESLIVYAVDVANYNSATIVQELRQTFESLQQLEIEKIAVNMSFALVPCSVVDDFLASRSSFDTLEEYLEAVTQGLAPEGSREQASLVEQLNTLMQSDPLGRYINDETPLWMKEVGQEIVYVASSGNFGLPYEMFPAGWPGVVGVGASDGVNPARPAVSSVTGNPIFNTGELMEVGAWYAITNPQNINGHGASQSIATYAGTSFSAPNVTFFSALDMASRQLCGFDYGNDRPYLAATTGSPRDLRLGSGVSKLCP